MFVRVVRTSFFVAESSEEEFDLTTSVDVERVFVLLTSVFVFFVTERGSVVTVVVVTGFEATLSCSKTPVVDDSTGIEVRDALPVDELP